MYVARATRTTVYMGQLKITLYTAPPLVDQDTLDLYKALASYHHLYVDAIELQGEFEHREKADPSGRRLISNLAYQQNYSPGVIATGIYPAENVDRFRLKNRLYIPSLLGDPSDLLKFIKDYEVDLTSLAFIPSAAAFRDHKSLAMINKTIKSRPRSVRTVII